MQFAQAFSLVVRTEGTYVNDPLDPGGETNYGISKRSYPMEDIANMTLDRARSIYLRDFWNPVCSPLPEELRYDLFDAAVNHGQHTAIKLLQRAVAETDDGVLGPLTLQAVQSVEPHRLLARFNGQRLIAYTDLPIWRRFGRGWALRVAHNLLRI